MEVRPEINFNLKKKGAMDQVTDKQGVRGALLQIYETPKFW